MAETTISCPNCRTSIPLTESLAAPIVEQRLKQERASIMADAQARAREAVLDDIRKQAEEIGALNDTLRSKNEKLVEAQRAQVELIRKQRELDDERREMELTIETRVTESLNSVRLTAKREAETELGLKVIERDQQIASMRVQIDELKNKAENSSQQARGEALELSLESLLKDKFPLDIVAPVPKGEFGGDILHTVKTASGASCGLILWESKRTKTWNDSWLAKLRADARAAKADLPVIVTAAMPKDIEFFDYVDGVWVVSIACAFPVAVALRQYLMEVAMARAAGEGQQTKMQLVYTYLTGPRFRARVSAIVEKFADMSEDLDKERKTMTKLWARREEQIRCVVDSTAGLYGDLQGIAGKTLLEIDGLSIDAKEKKLK